MSEKWWDMSDDELDDLFRDASDQVDVPFDSSAFDKLRHKMDSQSKPEPPKGFRRRWLLLLAGLFLLVGVEFVYRIGSSNDSDLSSENTVVLNGDVEKTDRKNSDKLSENQGIIAKESSNKSSVKTRTTAGEVINKSPVKTQTTAGEVINKSPVKIQTTAGEGINKSSVEVTGTYIQPKKNEQKVSINPKTNSFILETGKSSEKTQTTADEVVNTDYQTKINNKSIVSENRKETSISVNSIVKNENIDLSQKTENYTKTPDNQSIENIESSKSSLGNNRKSRNKNTRAKSLFQPIEVQNIDVPKIEESFISKENTSEETLIKTNFFGVDNLTNKNTKSLFTNVQAFEIQPYVDSLPRKTISSKFSRFGVRLVLAPEINSIENLGTSPLGGSLGLLFEYNISKKLILQTGLIYSNKKYGGSFDYYRNWSDWTKYHPSKPTNVDGGCKMIDLPINLRLNLFQKPKQTWFVSSGVTSYVMMNENYAYSYAWGPQKIVDWSDETKYYWSVLNFSVGFEKQFSKHLSLQIEPYLKTPLKSVGRGGVNLYSSGLMFSTKYAF